MSKRETSPIDPELARIDDLEALIIRGHDERVHFGAPAEEIAGQRPAVVAQAKAIAAKLRDDYFAWKRRS